MQTQKHLITFQGKTFDVQFKIDEGKIIRVIVNDGGLEFPFTNKLSASEFLVQEYGGTVEEVLQLFEELSNSNIEEEPKAITQEQLKEKKQKKSAEQKKSNDEKKSDYTYKRAKEDFMEDELTSKEVIFNLANGSVARTVKFRTVKSETPSHMEDVLLDDLHGLHIDIYGDKFRTCTIYKINGKPTIETDTLFSGNYPVEVVTNYQDIKGEVIIEGVALTDAVFKYAEMIGTTYNTADRYIKTKRGLLPPKNVKSNKSKAPINAEDFIARKTKNTISVDTL